MISAQCALGPKLSAHHAAIPQHFLKQGTIRMRAINTIIAATITAAASAVTITASAAEFATVAAPTPSADLTRRLDAVCQPGAYILTPLAAAACATQSFPRLAADGASFRNAGIGAELNTLMRQVPASATAAAAQTVNAGN